MEEAPKPGRRISRATARVLVFICLSVVTLSLVMYFTVSRDTVAALRSFDPLFLIALFAIWVMAFGMDAWSFFFYTRGTGEQLGGIASVKAAAFKVFFNLITPFGFGGQPFVVYYLKREGVPAGKGSSVVLMKLIIISLYVFSGAVAGFLFFHNHIGNSRIVNAAFFITAAIQLGLIALIVAGFRRPRAAIRALTSLGRLGARLGVVKNQGRFRRQLVHEAFLAKLSFQRYFSKHLVRFFLGTLCIGITYSVEVLTLWVIFRGLGVELRFTTGIALSSLLLFLLTFLPTPGAAGLGEGAFVVLFSSVVPYYLLGIAVVIWRFFYNYLTSILGALFSSRHFSQIIVGPSPGG